MGKKIDKFNCWYAFISNILKALAFLIVVCLLIYCWDSIDISPDKIIEKSTPFQWDKSEMFAIQGQADLDIAENQKASTPEKSENNLEVYQNNYAIFLLDKPYNIKGQKTFIIDKLSIIGSNPDYDKPFYYNGIKFHISKIKERIGLLVSSGRVEGPVLRGVECVID